MKKNAVNDGTSLEARVTYAAEVFEARGVALIRKIPNPWVVRRRGAQIISAVPVKQGRLVDYMGTVKGGRGIAFDAKSTTNTTAFRVRNVEPHQLTFLERTQKLGGVAFLLIEFLEHGEIYRVPIEAFRSYYDEAERGGRQSIPYADFVAKWDMVGTPDTFVDFLGAI